MALIVCFLNSSLLWFPVFSRVHGTFIGQLLFIWALGNQSLKVDSATSGIKASKTEPFCKGCLVHIVVGVTSLVCSSINDAVLHLDHWANSPEPQFLLQSGQPFTRFVLTYWLHDILLVAGIAGKLSSHGFRIGAATVASRNGIPNHQIQTLAIGAVMSTRSISILL